MQRKAIIILIVLSVICCTGYLRMRPEQEEIPQELLDFAANYPEAAPFVQAYPQEHDKKHSVSLSDEVTKGCIPLFLQWDTRWGYQPYGDGWIGNAGCGPTSLSMVMVGLTGDTSYDPGTMANFSEMHGWYETGVGTSWDLFTEGAPLLGLSVEEGSISMDYIQNGLTPQTPMIASMRPGDFTKGGHLLVLRGLDAGGRVLLNDPNSPDRSSHAWELEVLLPQIKALWKFSL